ncbi:MAG: hypothetical protein KDE51_01290 [Anaerolineales bacterium]|nr:hypothetical protein [Anaerolineales bacterium]
MTWLTLFALLYNAVLISLQWEFGSIEWGIVSAANFILAVGSLWANLKVIPVVGDWVGSFLTFVLVIAGPLSFLRFIFQPILLTVRDFVSVLQDRLALLGAILKKCVQKSEHFSLTVIPYQLYPLSCTLLE